MPLTAPTFASLERDDQMMAPSVSVSQAPTFSPAAMAPAASVVPPPAPRLPAPQPAPDAARGGIMAIFPLLMSSLATRDPRVIGGIARGLVKGRDAARAERESAFEREQRRQLERAKFYQSVQESANQYDDEVSLQRDLESVRPLAEYYGVPLDTIHVSDVKKSAKAKKDAQALLDTLVKTHGNQALDPAWQDAHTTTLNGNPVKISEVARLAQLPTVRDQSGSTVAPPLAPKDVPNTPEEQFYQQFAKEHGAASFGALSTTLQAQARKQWTENGRTSTVNVGSFEDYVVRKFGANPTPQQIAQARREYGDAGRAPTIVINPTDAAKDPRVEQAAQAIATHRLAPSQLATFFTGMGKGSVSQLRPAVMTRVLEIDPAFDFAGAESNYAFGKNVGVQQTVRFIDNIDKTLPVLEQASQEFSRTGVRSINSILKSGKSQFGAVDVVKFDMARTILADEVAKILQGGGTGSGTTDAKLRQANDLLAGDMTAAQFQTVLDTARELIATRRDTLTKGTFMERGRSGGATGGPAPAGGGITVGKYTVRVKGQ